MIALYLTLAQQTLVQPSAVSLGPTWELLKAVLLTLSTAAALWTARTVFTIRDEVRGITHELFGRDGNNGIKSSVKDNSTRLDAIEARHLALDAVEAAEKDLHEGDDRRRTHRRIVDKITQEHRK